MTKQFIYIMMVALTAGGCGTDRMIGCRTAGCNTTPEYVFLWSGAEDGNIERVKKAFEMGGQDFDVNNTVDDSGWTALMLASKNRHTEIVKLLISKNADVNVKNRKGETALFWAKGHPEIVKLLKEAGASEQT